MNTQKIGSNYSQIVSGNKKKQINTEEILIEKMIKKNRKSMKDFYY